MIRMSRKNTTKILKFIVVAVLFVIIQTVFIRFVEIGGVVPDMLFVFVVFHACVNRKFKEIIIVAVSFGIISDFICHSSFVGCTAVYTYCAASAYFLKNLFIKPNIFFVGVIALLIFMLGKSFQYPAVCKYIGFSGYFAKDVIPTGFYNTVCFFVMNMISVIAGRKGVKNDAL